MAPLLPIFYWLINRTNGLQGASVLNHYQIYDESWLIDKGSRELVKLVQHCTLQSRPEKLLRFHQSRQTMEHN